MGTSAAIPFWCTTVVYFFSLTQLMFWIDDWKAQRSASRTKETSG